jgi:hypothetical protein
MSKRTRTDEEIMSRLGQYNLQKHDYVFGIALTTSILISMLRSFVETSKKNTGEETPESVEELLENLEVMMQAMIQASGKNHIATGREKASLLLEEVFRVVMAPSTKVQ